MAINGALFPAMESSHYEVTSEVDASYNCIAWAAGRNDQWWEPLEQMGYYWPDDLPRDYSVNTLVALYEGLGYDLCESATKEPDAEKVAIYGQHGEWEHATRQLPDGGWTSKMGPDDDIAHDSHDRLRGPCYGQVAHVLRRSH